MLNINISNNVDIEYPAGDTFKFAVTEDNVIDASRRLRFQVSSNGNPKMIVIEKVFYPENNAFIISLSDDDTRKLEIHKTYEYRLTYFSVEDERTTTISGSLHVQWGAPNGNILHSPSVPTLHIGKLTIEKRMDSHRTSIELDHPDGSVTAKKIANGAISEDKIADGAVTGNKMANETISEDKLNEDVIGLIASNKFDGSINGYPGWESTLNEMDYPLDDTVIYKVYSDIYSTDTSGILMVATSSDSETGLLSYITQTFIDTYGSISKRTATVTSEGERTWTDWVSVYADKKTAITTSDLATYPTVSGGTGEAGIIKLGWQNGLTIVNGMLVVDPAIANTIKEKHSTRAPITPVYMAYATAMATHQSMDDDYDPDGFEAIGSLRDAATFFPVDKDNLPVSYKAVKEALANVDASASLKKTATAIMTENYYYTNEGNGHGFAHGLATFNLNSDDEAHIRLLITSENDKLLFGIAKVTIEPDNYCVEWEYLNHNFEFYPQLDIGCGTGQESIYPTDLYGVFISLRDKSWHISAYVLTSDVAVNSCDYGGAEIPFDVTGEWSYLGTAPTDKLTLLEKANNVTKEEVTALEEEIKSSLPYTVDEEDNVQYNGDIYSVSGESDVVTSELGVVGGTYNNEFGVALAWGTLLIYIESVISDGFFGCTHLKCTIDGTTILIPKSKLTSTGTPPSGSGCPEGSSAYSYSSFTTDYPQFADSYYEDYFNTNDVVVYGVVCETVVEKGYEISTNGKAEFNKSITAPLMYLTSPDGSYYKLTVDDTGALSTTKVSFNENGDEVIEVDSPEFE